jgi:hypothetical protein
MPDHLLRDVMAVTMFLVPVLVFLKDLRDRVAWVREAENGKEMLDVEQPSPVGRPA